MLPFDLEKTEKRSFNIKVFFLACVKSIADFSEILQFAGKDLHEVSINTRVSDMRILHIDTPVRLLERERSRKAKFSGKL